VRDRTKPVCGADPSSLPSKLWRLVKPLPSVWILKTVPLPKVPPEGEVPNRQLLLNVKEAAEPVPSLPSKLCKVVKSWASNRPGTNTPWLAIHSKTSSEDLTELFT
jgi:hypothetical protein